METIFEVLRLKQVLTKSEHPYAEYQLRSPEAVVKVIQSEIAHDDREVFLVLALDTKNKLMALHRCHIGSLNASIVHPREVMKSLILNNAASFIVAHQHPSGDVSPSQEDLEVTKRLVKAGEILGISLLDHLIVSPNNYYSLKEEGHI